jgi:hypothetical protein
VVITPALNLITIVGIAFRKNLMSSIKLLDLVCHIKLSPYMIMALVSAVPYPL